MAEFFKSKQNKFYAENVEYIDYKDVKTLQRYLNSMGKIEPRKKNRCEYEAPTHVGCSPEASSTLSIVTICS